MTKIEISFISTLKFISLILDIPNMEKEALFLRKKKRHFSLPVDVSLNQSEKQVHERNYLPSMDGRAHLKRNEQALPSDQL